MKRIALLGAALAALSVAAACTPQEVEVWQQWRAQDPAAADAWANDWLAQQGGGGGGGGDSVWDRIAECESGGNWSINTGNGYYGGLQYSASTWRAYGGTDFAPLPHQATREQQIAVGERTYADVGDSAWPHCGSRL
jgi:hypothetical protein